MIIKSAEYFPFSISLRSSFETSAGIINSRNGFILKLTDELGNISFGECSPLPGFSKESLHDAEISLQETIASLLETKFETELSFSSNCSSVSFAVEQALLNFASARNRIQYFQKLNLKSKRIPVNAVIGFDTYESIFDNIKRKIDLGYTTFKIKVGRENPYEDYELIETIRINFGFNIKLRLDVNQKWSADEAIEYLDRLKAFEIEYVEEPCQFASSTLRTQEETHIPIALDESLDTFAEIEELIVNSNTEYFVIKPMVLGGIFAAIKIIKLAEQHKKIVIISSSFESALGKQANVMLASLTNHNLAHGLDTYDFFVKDICNDAYQISQGNIYFDASAFPLKSELALQ